MRDVDEHERSSRAASPRDIALRELQERAQEAGGNAVVGVDLDYEVLGQGTGCPRCVRAELPWRRVALMVQVMLTFSLRPCHHAR